MSTYRDEWFGADDEAEDESEPDKQVKTETGPKYNWQCYSDLTKSHKAGRKRYTVEYHHEDGETITHDCTCGGVGHHTRRNICIHRYRMEYDGDYKEWDFQYY